MILILDGPATQQMQTIDQGSGVMRQCVMRFVKGRTTLQLDSADKLAAYFRIECRRRKTKQKG